MPTPIHGVDFLYHFYDLLQIDALASRDEIAAAFRRLQLQYHPDRYVGLADELKSQAAQMSEVLSLAYATLSNPDKRAAYDQLLGSWDGPISHDGVPIIDLRRSSLAGLLQFDDDSWQALAAKIDQLSGLDQGTYEFLEEQYLAAEQPSLKLVEAYVAALHRRLASLAVKEGELLSTLGVKFDNNRASLAEHSTKVEQAIASQQSDILRLTTGSESAMLSQGERVTEVHKQTGQPANQALVAYESVSQKVLDISHERQIVINQLMSVTELRKYQPPQADLFPNLFVGLDFGETAYWFLFRFKDSEVTQDDQSFTQEQMRELFSPEAAETVIAQGYNVLLVQQQDGIDFLDQVTAAVQWHFDQRNS